jgi:hypothetical protein
MERDAQAGPEADRQAEAPYEMEMELYEIRPRWRRGRSRP